MQNFARLGEKSIEIWNFWENFKIYIKKSQWKIDFLPIFSPIFQNLCHFMHLWNTQIFWGWFGGLFRRDWGGVFSMTLDFGGLAAV